MKRIYRAINEGLDKSLMNFDDNGLKKSNYILNNVKQFYIGDYVYKDPKLGYNNYIGEKVAICVNDDPGKELYAVLDHPLLSKECKWSNIYTNLHKDELPDFEDGLKNTLYILNNYGDELIGTLWDQLNGDEYIPSIELLEIIYNNCYDTDLWDLMGFVQEGYWSSSHCHNFYNHNLAFSNHFYDGYTDFSDKTIPYRSVALINIKSTK